MMDAEKRNVVLVALGNYRYYDEYECSFTPDEIIIVLDALLAGTNYIPLWERVKDGDWTGDKGDPWDELYSLIRNDK